MSVKRLTILLLVTGLLLSIMYCDKKNSAGTEAVTIEDLLVKDNEISGWSRTGEFWTASSSTELEVYINGAAELYKIYGFTEAASQRYEGPIDDVTESITVRIYDQGSQENADALFTHYVDGLSNPETWDEVGDDARIERYAVSMQIVFQKSKYFITLEVGSGLEKALDILKSFARNVDRKI